MSDELLKSLDPEQQVAAAATRGPVMILAGAGTGKTRTLTHRLAYAVATGVVDGRNVLAVTHSTKAAGELRERLGKLRTPGVERINARTFHSAALRQLRYFWSATGRNEALQLADNRYAIVRAVLREAGKDPDTASVLDVSGEVTWAKARMVSAAAYPAAARAAGRVTAKPAEEIAKYLTGYERLKTAAGTLDFEDLLLVLAELLETNDDVAAKIRAQYHYFTVDEYQDCDPLQERLLEAWLGPGEELCVVGDPRQSIFGFKGADEKALARFATRYPAATVVSLVRDYRSSPQIVSAANQLMRHAGDGAKALIGCNQDGPVPSLSRLPDEDAEAAWVAGRVAAALRGGIPGREIAILYRFNSQAAAFEQALAALGVPYSVADSERFFDRQEIRSVVSELSRRAMQLGGADAQSVEGWSQEGIDDPEDDSESEVAAEQLSESVGSGCALLRQVLADTGFLRDTPPAGAGAARDRWEAWSALLHLAEGLPGAELLSAQSLVGELELRRSEQHGATTDAVTLSTLHKAKGLEWDLVVMPRMSEGSLPSAYATTPGLIDEERRLAYVGVTRGRKVVLLSCAKQGRWPLTPSRFLVELGVLDASEAGKPRRKDSTRASKGQLGSNHGRCESCDTPLSSAGLGKLKRCGEHLEPDAAQLLGRLKAWRSEQSSTLRVPAFAVLSDATLYELIVRRPKTVGELIQVPGVGTVKQQRFGQGLLDVLGG